MTDKIYVELKLRQYTKAELMELLRLDILTKDEVKSELMMRGMNEWAVIAMIRAA